MTDFFLSLLLVFTLLMIPGALTIALLYGIYKIVSGDGDGHIHHLDHPDHHLDTEPSPLLGVVSPKDKDK